MAVHRSSEQLRSGETPLARAQERRLTRVEGERLGSGVGGIDALSRQLTSLRAQARTLTRSETDAEDLVQETCVRALEELARTQTPIAIPAAWLRVVMRNSWIDMIRSRKAEAAANCAVGAELVDCGLVGARVTRRQLARIWERLPRKARHVVVECVLEGEERVVVARTSGVTTAAIEASIFRVRRVFRNEGLGPPRCRSAGSSLSEIPCKR